MTDLVEFLQARLGEDEQAARRASRFKYDRPTDAPWEKARLALGNSFELSSSAHIARHDPARVLREVEAKRRTIDEIVPKLEEMWCAINGEWGADADDPDGEALLKMLGLPYADHPDYREEWRP